MNYLFIFLIFLSINTSFAHEQKLLGDNWIGKVQLSSTQTEPDQVAVIYNLRNTTLEEVSGWKTLDKPLKIKLFAG